MRNHWKFLSVLGLQLLSTTGYAQPLEVNSLSYASTSQQLRMQFDVSASPKHRVFVLNKPARLVIDIQNAHLAQTLAQPAPSHPLFAKIRYAAQNNGADLRVVVDLKKPVNAKNFALSSNNKDEHKLLVELQNKELPPTLAKAPPPPEPIAIQQPIPVTPIIEPTPEKIAPPPVAMVTAKEKPIADVEPVTQVVKNTTIAKRNKEIVIAIDAGHGGEDPGAHGLHGTEEKQVVYAIAKKLEQLIANQHGMKAVLVRKGDYFIALRDRMRIAREANADLFISIHADAFQNTEVKGASVYTLSRNGASSEAALWLANSENASDLVGGIRLDDKEEVLASVLLDLSQTATQEASVTVADKILQSLSGVSELHRPMVQKAGFMVLKSPDIPSILVETAFISNPQEEQKLLNTNYQNHIATAIFNGLCDYFRQPPAPPANSKMAAL